MHIFSKATLGLVLVASAAAGLSATPAAAQEYRRDYGYQTYYHNDRDHYDWRYHDQWNRRDEWRRHHDWRDHNWRDGDRYDNHHDDYGRERWGY
jgi:hypothetical protein